MSATALTAGLAGTIIGYLAKTIIDFVISANKDGFKDYKAFLLELMKGIESTAEQLNKDVFLFYTTEQPNLTARRNQILKIENEFKYLGIQINKLKITIASQTDVKENFASELLEFRSKSTIDIHNAALPGFDSIGKVQETHSRYIGLRTKLLAIKTEIALYQGSTHMLRYFRLLGKK